jgi:hypothetical protein
MKKRASCKAAHIVEIVTLAPHPLNRHVEMAVFSCGHWRRETSYVAFIDDWVTQRFRPVPRSVDEANRNG